MRVFDNSNLNESYAGVVSPMTFSFICRVYSQVYMQFCALFGVSQKTIVSNKDLYSNLLAYIGGRAYYQLHNWHTMFMLFPGYSYNGKFLEEMMGIEKSSQGKVEVVQIRSTIFSFFNSMYIACRMIGIFILMPYLIKSFSRNFDNKYKIASQVLLSPVSSITDMKHRNDLYQKIEMELTHDFRIPIANDMAVMIASGIHKMLCRHWFAKSGEAFAIKRMGGTMGLKSAEPGKQLFYLIELIRKDKKLTYFITHHNSKKSISILKSNKKYSVIYAKFIDYINVYGSRIPGELKLETVSFADSPEILLNLIKNNLNIDSSKQTTHTRTVAQEILHPTFVQGIILTQVERWLSKSVAKRELTRFHRTKIFDLMRQYLNILGKFLYQQKYLRAPEDIFFLTLEDLSTIPSKNEILGIIKDRKKQQRIYQMLNMPRRIESPSGNIDLHNYRITQKRNSNISLKGTIASSGNYQNILSGTALVLNSFNPKRQYSGKILVTQQTDPGWTIIFPMLKGIIVERGGMLSHAAIISREFGIPCIMGVEYATSKIKNGQKISIDIKKSCVYTTR